MASRALNNKQILKEILPHVSDKIIDEMLKYCSHEALNHEAYNNAIEQSIGYPGCPVAKAVVDYAHNSCNIDLYDCYVHVAEDNGFDIVISYNESRPKGWIVSIMKDGVEISSQSLVMERFKLAKHLTCYPSLLKAQKEIIHQTVYELGHILRNEAK